MPSAPLYACAYVCAGATRLRAHIHAHAYRGAEGTIYNNKAEPCSAGAEQRRAERGVKGPYSAGVPVLQLGQHSKLGSLMG